MLENESSAVETSTIMAVGSADGTDAGDDSDGSCSRVLVTCVERCAIVVAVKDMSFCADDDRVVSGSQMLESTERVDTIAEERSSLVKVPELSSMIVVEVED